MEDGSPLPKRVPILRDCGANRVIHEAVADRNGHYVLRLVEASGVTGVDLHQMSEATIFMSAMRCVLRASSRATKHGDRPHRSGVPRRSHLLRSCARPRPEAAFSTKPARRAETGAQGLGATP
jgi:hypothetical protein